jgi:YD repeat-containing protein
LDQVKKVTYPDGTHKDIEYVCCALPGMTRDRAGRKTYYDYDPLKRLKRVQDVAGHNMTYDYDADDDLLRLTMAKFCGGGEAGSCPPEVSW